MKLRNLQSMRFGAIVLVVGCFGLWVQPIHSQTAAVVTFPTEDGATIQGTLHLPATSGSRVPGIVLLAHFTPLFGLSHGPHPLNGLLVVALCIALAWAVAEIVARIPMGRTLRIPSHMRSAQEATAPT